jgi:hypothetical protein
MALLRPSIVSVGFPDALECAHRSHNYFHRLHWLAQHCPNGRPRCPGIGPSHSELFLLIASVGPSIVSARVPDALEWAQHIISDAGFCKAFGSS